VFFLAYEPLTGLSLVFKGKLKWEDRKQKYNFN
jgi:hypothetical protein